MRKALPATGLQRETMSAELDAFDAMTHIVMGQALDGKAVRCMEKVTDEQCQAPKGAR